MSHDGMDAVPEAFLCQQEYIYITFINANSQI